VNVDENRYFRKTLSCDCNCLNLNVAILIWPKNVLKLLRIFLQFYTGEITENGYVRIQINS
jgi:hypothetical protein